MADLLSYVPVAAAVFAVPQFAPQIRRLRTTGDVAGVSWSWAALTCVNNAGWLVYFTLARYWAALVPAVSVAVLAGILAIMLTRRGRAGWRPLILTSVWGALLVTACAVAGGAGLGTLLTAGFIVQVTPPLRAAYRSARPTGVSAGTWLLIFGEVACWLIFGVQESDPRVVVLGAAGVVASALVLARIQYSASGSTAAADSRSSLCPSSSPRSSRQVTSKSVRPSSSPGSWQCYITTRESTVRSMLVLREPVKPISLLSLETAAGRIVAENEMSWHLVDLSGVVGQCKHVVELLLREQFVRFDALECASVRQHGNCRCRGGRVGHVRNRVRDPSAGFPVQLAQTPAEILHKPVRRVHAVVRYPHQACSRTGGV